MTPDSYAIAWGFYIAGGLGLLVCWCWLTAGIKHNLLKQILRLIVAVLIFFPFNVGDGYEQLAPGTLMLLLETVFEGGEAFARVGWPLLIALVCFLTVGIGAGVFVRKRLQQKQEAAALTAVHDELVANSQQETSERREPSL